MARSHRPRRAGTGPRRAAPSFDLLLAPSADIGRLVSRRLAAGSTPADLPITAGLSGDIVSTLTLHTGNAHTIQSETSLAKLGHTTETARSAALERLVAAVSGCDVNRDDPWLRITSSDFPEVAASFLIIVDGWLPGLALGDSPVIAIPRRSELYLCRGEDTAAVDGLRAHTAASYAESVAHPGTHGYPLTDSLLTVRDGELIPLP